MSHTNRNFVLAYIFLVALPVLGLVGVLKRGRTLSAPFSVDGAWKIEPADRALSSSSCGAFLSSVLNAPISISQSGKTLVVAVSGGARTTTGTLEGKIINAEFAAADLPAALECGDHGLTLTATLDPLAGPRTLNGTISIKDCASCTPMEFRAVRQPRSPGGTR
jgi:hypothetical protein